MREQNEDMVEKLAAAESALQESRMKQETYFYAKRQLDQWRQIVFKLCSQAEREAIGENVGPDMLSGKISKLQQDMVTKTEAIASLEQSLAQKKEELKSSLCQIEDLNQKSHSDKQNLTEQANLIKRFKRKLLLVSKERDSYKGVLESYEHELTFNGATFEKDRVKALEESLQEYRETVERLEELLGAARSASSQRELEASLRAEIIELKAKLQQAATSDHREAENQASGSKVIHFLNNPLQQATEARKHELEDLKAEVTALRARVKLLEEGETSNLTLLVGRKMEEGFSSEEIIRLKSEIESAKKKQDRLIEAFTKKGQDFRNAVCQLTGFQFDALADDSMYRVKPVAYAVGDTEDHLLFKARENGKDFGMVPTSFAQQPHIQKMVDLHFQQQASIPMLLAAILTDQFENCPTDSSHFEQTGTVANYQGEAASESESERDGGDSDNVEAYEEEDVCEEEEFEDEQGEEEELQEEMEQSESNDDENENDDDDDDEIVCLE